jgi:hypothetical protein
MRPREDPGRLVETPAQAEINFSSGPSLQSDGRAAGLNACCPARSRTVPVRLFARVDNAVLQPALKLNRRLILKRGAQFDPLARRKIP